MQTVPTQPVLHLLAPRPGVLDIKLGRRGCGEFLMNTILIVEDHAEVREPLAKLLRYEGYQTLSAPNGNDAMALLASHPVDLVLLDLMLPKMDGLAVLQAIRADPRWQPLPVIVLTGLIEGSPFSRARELNVAAILYKSKFTVDELYSQIRHNLQESARCLSAPCA